MMAASVICAGFVPNGLVDQFYTCPENTIRSNIKGLNSPKGPLQFGDNPHSSMGIFQKKCSRK